MPLPVLPARRSNADLLRLFCRTELLRSDPLAEQTPLQSGTALTNPALPAIAAANRMLDAAIPAGWSAEQTLAEVSAHFSALGVCCLEWWPNLSQPSDPLAAALLAAGYSARPVDVHCIPAPARPPVPTDRPGLALSVYSARAAIGQARALAEEMAEGHPHHKSAAFGPSEAQIPSPGTPGEGQGGGVFRAESGIVGCSAPSDIPPPLPSPGVPGEGKNPQPDRSVPHRDQNVEAFLLHLDNPHYELLIASQAGEPIGMVGILSAGDLGRIDPLFVRPAHRRRGIGRLLLDRAIELCARSRFADCVAAPPSAAVTFSTLAGFRPVGQLIVYRMDFI